MRSSKPDWSVANSAPYGIAASVLAALVAAVAAVAIATAAAVAVISGVNTSTIAGSSVSTAIFIAAVLAAAASGLLAACIAGPQNGPTVPWTLQKPSLESADTATSIAVPLEIIQDGLKTLVNVTKSCRSFPQQRFPRRPFQRTPAKRRQHRSPSPEDKPCPRPSSAPSRALATFATSPSTAFHERCGRILQTCDLLVRHFPPSRTLCILRTAEGILARRPRPSEPTVESWESDIDVDLDPVLTAPNLDEALRLLDHSIRSAKRCKERKGRLQGALQSTALVMEAEKRRTKRSPNEYGDIIDDEKLDESHRRESSDFSISDDLVSLETEYIPKPKARSSLLHPKTSKFESADMLQTPAHIAEQEEDDIPKAICRLSEEETAESAFDYQKTTDSLSLIDMDADAPSLSSISDVERTHIQDDPSHADIKDEISDGTEDHLKIESLNNIRSSDVTVLPELDNTLNDQKSEELPRTEERKLSETPNKLHAKDHLSSAGETPEIAVISRIPSFENLSESDTENNISRAQNSERLPKKKTSVPISFETAGRMENETYSFDSEDDVLVALNVAATIGFPTEMEEDESLYEDDVLPVTKTSTCDFVKILPTTELGDNSAHSENNSMQTEEAVPAVEIDDNKETEGDFSQHERRALLSCSEIRNKIIRAVEDVITPVEISDGIELKGYSSHLKGNAALSTEIQAEVKMEADPTDSESDITRLIQEDANASDEIEMKDKRFHMEGEGSDTLQSPAEMATISGGLCDATDITHQPATNGAKSDVLNTAEILNRSAGETEKKGLDSKTDLLRSAIHPNDNLPLEHSPPSSESSEIDHQFELLVETCLPSNEEIEQSFSAVSSDCTALDDLLTDTVPIPEAKPVKFDLTHLSEDTNGAAEDSCYDLKGDPNHAGDRACTTETVSNPGITDVNLEICADVDREKTPSKQNVCPVSSEQDCAVQERFDGDSEGPSSALDVRVTLREENDLCSDETTPSDDKSLITSHVGDGDVSLSQGESGGLILTDVLVLESPEDAGNDTGKVESTGHTPTPEPRSESNFKDAVLGANETLRSVQVQESDCGLGGNSGLQYDGDFYKSYPRLVETDRARSSFSKIRAWTGMEDSINKASERSETPKPTNELTVAEDVYDKEDGEVQSLVVPESFNFDTSDGASGSSSMSVSPNPDIGLLNRTIRVAPERNIERIKNEEVSCSSSNILDSGLKVHDDKYFPWETTSVEQYKKVKLDCNFLDEPSTLVTARKVMTYDDNDMPTITEEPEGHIQKYDDISGKDSDGDQRANEEGVHLEHNRIKTSEDHLDELSSLIRSHSPRSRSPIRPKYEPDLYSVPKKKISPYSGEFQESKSDQDRVLGTNQVKARLDFFETKRDRNSEFRTSTRPFKDTLTFSSETHQVTVSPTVNTQDTSLTVLQVTTSSTISSSSSEPCSDALPCHFFRSLERRQDRKSCSSPEQSFPLSMRVPHRRAFWDSKVTENTDPENGATHKRQPSIRVPGIVQKCKETLQTMSVSPDTPVLATGAQEDEHFQEDHRQKFQEVRHFFENLQSKEKAPEVHGPRSPRTKTPPPVKTRTVLSEVSDIPAPAVRRIERQHPATVSERFNVSGVYRDVVGDGAAKTAGGLPLRGVPRRKAVLATLHSFHNN